MESCVYNNFDFVKLLLESAANVHLKDTNGWTALHFAAQEDNVKIVELLLDSGANIDERDQYGNTPLNKAVFYSRGYGDIILLLLERGADKGLENNYGVSPLSLAESISNYDVIKFFSS